MATIKIEISTAQATLCFAKYQISDIHGLMLRRLCLVILLAATGVAAVIVASDPNNRIDLAFGGGAFYAGR